VINIAFAESITTGSATMQFTPVISSVANFKSDIVLKQSQSKKVLISIGGANSSIELTNTADENEFLNSVITIIEEYGFDGIDIDLEASSIRLDGGYTSPSIVHDALDYVVKGQSYGGNYTPQNSAGYPNFRGLMTWSINWDSVDSWEFINNHRSYLDALESLAKKPVLRHNQADIPFNYTLSQNYPNPFNPTTVINYTLPERSEVSIKVYDLSGKEIATLINEEKDMGQYKVLFDASDLHSDIYFYKFQTGHFIQVRRIVPVK